MQETVPHQKMFAVGLIDCTKEPRYQQLRTAGLDCFEACLKAPGGKNLSGDSFAKIKECLCVVAAEDKVAQVKAQASAILELLPQDSQAMMVDS